MRTHDTHDEFEAVAPVWTVVVPREVLRLLEHGNISLLARNEVGDVAQGKDRTTLLVLVKDESESSEANLLKLSEEWILGECSF